MLTIVFVFIAILLFGAGLIIIFDDDYYSQDAFVPFIFGVIFLCMSYFAYKTEEPRLNQEAQQQQRIIQQQHNKQVLERREICKAKFPENTPDVLVCMQDAGKLVIYEGM